MIFTFPTPGFVSTVGFAVSRLAGDRVQIAPGAALGSIHFSLFLLGKLFVGNKLFHFRFLLNDLRCKHNRKEENSQMKFLEVLLPFHLPQEQ